MTYNKSTLAAASTAIASTFLLHGCSSLPDRIDTLEQARSSVQSLQREPLVAEVAPTQFDKAKKSLALAEEAYEEKEPLELIEHNAYLALRNAQIAEQMIAENRARDEIQKGEAERTQVQLEAREQEVRRAEREAANNLALANQRGAAVDTQVALTEEARRRAEELARELADLKAEQTERGMVLTLGDVLFDTGRANLKAGADVTIQRLAQFMNTYPDYKILVEGHTDAVGSDESNRTLSEQRAEAVRSAVMNQGIASTRVQTRGLGEMYPLASNDSPDGRQLNRRVEIVISDDTGQFPNAAQRSAAAR